MSREQLHANQLAGYAFQEKVYQKYGGYKNVAFLHGKVVKPCKGAVIPDIIKKNDDHLEAIEVKRIPRGYWDKAIIRISEQVRNRNIHLPEGTTQRLIFADLGFTEEEKAEIVEKVQHALSSIYESIPIEFMRDAL